MATIRPEPYPYDFRYLLSFPKRLFYPPVPTVASVRSLRLTPFYRVKLDDVLNARHLPPLGRKEFEDFLYFKEYSAENLYFHVWLSEYEKAYRVWENSPMYPKPSPKLALSYTRAKQTFLTPGSPHELNLPEVTRQALLFPQRPHPGPKAHPAPPSFAAVKFEVDRYLNESLTRFITANTGNAGRSRGLFALIVGLAVMGIGLVPIILSCLHLLPHQSRLIRLSAIPALWFGLATVIAGLHGVCVVIFLFGDARQLYPWELVRPSISSPIELNRQASRTSIPYVIDIKEGPDTTEGPQKKLRSYPSLAELGYDQWKEDAETPHRSRASSDATRNLNHDGGGEYYSPNSAVPLTKQISPTSPTATHPDPAVAFDFDSLPLPPGMAFPEWMSSTGAPSETSKKSKWSWAISERTMFAPLTKVFDPVVTRAQWQIVIRSCVLAIPISAGLAGISMSIP